MSRFLTPTDVRVLRGQFRQGRQLFKLINAVVYDSDLLGALVTVPAGYVTDFASVPKIPLAWLAAGGTAYEAAVIHDWLYTVHSDNGKPITRAQADAVFREAIGVSEDSNAPGWLMWLAVRMGGWRSWAAQGPDQPPHVATVIEATEVPVTLD